MTTTTDLRDIVLRVEAALAPHTTRRGTIRVGAEITARNAAGAIIGRHIPAETLGWLASPGHREASGAYAVRMVLVANARCAWAGGLT